MSRKALFALTGLVVLLCSGLSYSWTAPVVVTPSPPPQTSGAYNVTPNSEAVQRTISFSNQVRVLFNWNQAVRGGSFTSIGEALSTNGGSSFTSWGQVYSSPNLIQYSPSLVKVGNVLHATWYQDNGLGAADIFYARSTNFGATWSVGQTWTWQFTIGSGPDEFPHLAVSSNGQQVVIVWRLGYQSGTAVFVTSLDGGLTWSSPASITGDLAYLTNVAYTSYSGGRFIAVYSKVESPTIRIWSTKLPYGGTTWTAPIVVNNFYTDTPRYFPTVATNNSADVMCVWQYAPGQTGNIFGSNRSLDGGDSWPDSSEQDFGFSHNPYDLVVSPWQSLTYDPCNGSYLCTWTAKPSSAYDIYVSEYVLGQYYWGNDVQITNNLNGYGSHGPRVSAYPSRTGWTRFITFSNGPDKNSLSVWESQSGCIPSLGGGGQSKGAVQRPDVGAPMVRAVPNPASRFVTISYFLGEGIARRTLRVYSITGQLVKVLDLEASMRDLRWDLKDERGNLVPNGIYYLRLEGTGVPIGERLVVLR